MLQVEVLLDTGNVVLSHIRYERRRKAVRPLCFPHPSVLWRYRAMRSFCDVSTTKSIGCMYDCVIIPLFVGKTPPCFAGSFVSLHTSTPDTIQLTAPYCHQWSTTIYLELTNGHANPAFCLLYPPLPPFLSWLTCMQPTMKLLLLPETKSTRSDKS